MFDAVLDSTTQDFMQEALAFHRMFTMYETVMASFRLQLGAAYVPDDEELLKTMMRMSKGSFRPSQVVQVITYMKAPRLA